MQIVIDIDDNLYTRLFDNGVDNYDDAVDMAKAIRKGAVLPKKHGRIADMDEAIKCIEEVTGNDATYAISLIEWACSKRTILESTRGDNNADSN